MQPLILAAVLGAASPSFAKGVDVALTSGTLGIGPQIAWSIVPDSYAARLQLGYFSLNYSMNSDGVAYKGKVKLLNAGLLGDWYPWAGAFRLTGGLFYNRNSLDLHAQPSGGSFTFAGDIYPAAQVGTADGQVSFNALAPYIGLGWGGDRAGWRFTGDVGVMYQGTPKVRLAVSNMAASRQLEADLLATQTKLQSSLDSYRFYPVVQLGLSYRF